MGGVTIAPVPWLPHSATGFLESFLQPEMRVFEWGSGGSTLFFAKRVALVVSVEHSGNFLPSIREALVEHKIENCDLLHIPPELGEIGTHVSNPEHYFSGHYPGQNFERYASAIDGRELFDLVMVDGRARPSCIKHGHELVRPGGYLMLDNSSRSHYRPALAEFLANWECRVFFGYGPYLRNPWRCTTWRRIQA